MANLLLPTAPSTTIEPGLEAHATPARQTGALLFASFGDPVAHDCAALAHRTPHAPREDNHLAERDDYGAPIRNVDLTQADAAADLRSALESTIAADVVLFLPRNLDDAKRATLDGVIALASEHGVRSMVLVSSLAAHFGDDAIIRTETSALERLRGTSIRAAILRPAHILSPHSPATANLRRLGFLAPLIPARMSGCCVDAHELLEAVECIRNTGRQRRVYSLLGPNRPWKHRLREHRPTGFVQTCLTGISWLLAILLVGQLAALLFDLLAHWMPSLRRWSFDTLRPSSFAELLALCNPCNFQHVKVVGYNNGVVHFGQKFTGKTVVSTVLCNRVTRTGPTEIATDCGATIRKARDFLAGSDQELYVIPNYSYVCLGTAFFVPIHGSASDYATVAETITRVLLYDPVRDRFIRATSDEAAFRNYVYRMDAPVLLLRLRLRVKSKSNYFVHRVVAQHAGADELLNALCDKRATNVEIRQAKAASSKVEISKYYQADDRNRIADECDLLDIPRDSLGRLWDRLEENAITSFLMHGLTRWFGWHVELFFSADEFRAFWETHHALPLNKIQLRFIRRDGLPHSPFREHDCVSVDMFMFRWNRRAFEGYVRRTFKTVRANPGKHSQ